MAYPDSQAETDKNPQTRCSTCQTVFEVPRELLASSDTRVRCGECLSIFDALDGLRSPAELAQDARSVKAASKGLADRKPRQKSHDNAEQAALAGLANDTAALDVTYSDFDLFSEEADLPEIAYFDQTRDTPEFDFDAIDVEDDETFSDTLFVHDVTINAEGGDDGANATASQQAEGSFATVDFVADETPREPLIFEYKDPEPEEEHRDDADSALDREAANGQQDVAPAHTELVVPAEKNSPWLFRSVMTLLLALILGGLYGYRHRAELHYNPVVRPVMVAACNVIGCSVPARVDMDAMTLLRGQAYAHPSLPDALKINVSFRNDAPFEQPYPVIVMRLTNQLGRVVSKRELLPEDYLDQWQPGDTINSKKQLDVSLEVSKPARSVGYFDFRLREM